MYQQALARCGSMKAIVLELREAIVLTRTERSGGCHISG
jgi:hypothetical protein